MAVEEALENVFLKMNVHIQKGQDYLNSLKMYSLKVTQKTNGIPFSRDSFIK